MFTILRFTSEATLCLFTARKLAIDKANKYFCCILADSSDFFHSEPTGMILLLAV